MTNEERKKRINNIVEVYESDMPKKIIAGEKIFEGDAIYLGDDGKCYKVKPKLTHDVYHTIANRHLTNSRIGDWLKDKRYFYERHITGERPNGAETDALKIGQAVDTFIFQGEEAFRNKFIGVTRRSLKNAPINVTELTEKQYADCEQMAKILLKQPAVIEMAEHRTQDIMTATMDLGQHFCGLSAIPDWWTIEGDTAIITDLKTAYEANENKYHWKCLAFGYYRQVALMRMIIEINHPEVKNFVYRHIVIEKDKEGIFLPFAYYLSDDQVNASYDDIKNNILPAIKAEKDFAPKLVDWKSASTVGDINNDF